MSDKPNMFDDEGCQYECLVVDNLKSRIALLGEVEEAARQFKDRMHCPFRLADLKDALAKLKESER